MTAEVWQTLGGVAPGALTDARLQLHYAAQVVSAVGASLLEPQPDDSHPNLGWSEELGGLTGHHVPGARSFRAALQFAELRLLLLDGNGQTLAEFPLDGRSLDAAMHWLSSAIEANGTALPADGIRRPPYELPDHPVATGASFSHSAENAYAELARWYANAGGALAKLVSHIDGASTVRCWPHHFDIATLVVLERTAEGDMAKTVGIGLSPGDSSYDEPYWYVSPWPAPDAEILPPLDVAGRWHTEGFTAAVLTGSELTADGSASQSEKLDNFLDRAFAASRLLLTD
ncbi:MAG: hypothetical protein O6922_06475 [Chloroflexi bacterium]|nr:hypothetical protein [Chloroflexota bacterium]